jgi:pyridoxamine 5'-phosphate oxidase
VTDPQLHGESLKARTEYDSATLSEADVDPDPLAQFARWLDEAEAAGVYQPNAMVISTIDAEGRPSSRTVLLRGLHADGFEFFTDYDSRKGRALAANPRVSLVFPWYAQQRQVLVEGTATRTTAAISDAYFDSRPRGSQIAARASDQSRPISGRAELEARVAALEKEYPEETPVPRPDNWGGFRVQPNRIEFWQGRVSRLHDRIHYSRLADGGWELERLQP